MSESAPPLLPFQSEIRKYRPNQNQLCFRHFLFHFLKCAHQILLSLAQLHRSNADESGLCRDRFAWDELRGVHTVRIDYAFGFGNAIIEHRITNESGWTDD